MRKANKMDTVSSGAEKGEEHYRDELIGVSGDSKDAGFYSQNVGSPEEPGSQFMSGISSSFPPDSRIQQAFVVGNKVISSASKYNPLKDISSVQQLSARLKKEAVGCFDPREYSKPATRDECMARLRSNVGFFRISYGVIFAFFLVYFLLTSPFLLFELALVVGVWVYFFKLKGEEAVTIGSYKLENREKLAVACVLTVLVALFGGIISYLIWVCVVSGIVISIHAAFRKQIEPNPLDDLAEAQQQFV